MDFASGFRRLGSAYTFELLDPYAFVACRILLILAFHYPDPDADADAYRAVVGKRF